MNGNLSVIPTLDGSNTFYDHRVGQSYHSINGALQESKHVFLVNGLIHYLEKYDPSTITILEVGFGAGLNFLITADYCRRENIRLEYTGIEPFPLQARLFVLGDYSKWLRDETLWNNLASGYSGAWTPGASIDFGSGIDLKLVKLPLLEYPSGHEFNMVFYDAFSPLSQPGMWLSESIDHVSSLLDKKGYFISYSITGDVKRILRSRGFIIEKPKGAAGKREMLRAYRSSNSALNL